MEQEKICECAKLWKDFRDYLGHISTYRLEEIPRQVEEARSTLTKIKEATCGDPAWLMLIETTLDILSDATRKMEIKKIETSRNLIRDVSGDVALKTIVELCGSKAGAGE
jgi:hypothetical protein